MYVNAKMIPVETVPGIMGGRRAVDWVNSHLIYLIHCKNLCKCYNVFPAQIKILQNSTKTVKYLGRI
jgi:hypothetical protein